MKIQIINLLSAVARDVQLRVDSVVFNRCEFWFNADCVPFGVLRQIESLSSRLTIGVIGYSNGQYYISVYGLYTEFD